MAAGGAGALVHRGARLFSALVSPRRAWFMDVTVCLFSFSGFRIYMCVEFKHHQADFCCVLLFHPDITEVDRLFEHCRAAIITEI